MRPKSKLAAWIEPLAVNTDKIRRVPLCFFCSRRADEAKLERCSGGWKTSGWRCVDRADCFAVRLAR